MLTPVRLQLATVDGHEDHRRIITDIVVGDGIPFTVQQAKVIRFKPEAVGSMAVGNHYHSVESKRWELFVAVGPKDIPLFKFRWREAGKGGYDECLMKNGDQCLVPPGNTHAFLPLHGEATLWGFSNLTYDKRHDVSDKLF